MFDWYGEFPDLVISNIDIFFDRDDPFLHVLMQQWNTKKIREKFPWWGLVSTTAPATARDVPALQAADMLA